MISEDLCPSRIWLRRCLARATGLEERASMFHDVIVRGLGTLCSTCFCAFLFLGGSGAHLWVEELNMESVRQTLLVVMAEKC
jgi:hypothetical protein